MNGVIKILAQNASKTHTHPPKSVIVVVKCVRQVKTDFNGRLQILRRVISFIILGKLVWNEFMSVFVDSLKQTKNTFASYRIL